MQEIEIPMSGVLESETTGGAGGHSLSGPRRPRRTAGTAQEGRAAGANALKTPAPTAPAEQPSAPATAPSKPLAPLGALWPSSVLPRGESKPPQGPAPQKVPATATLPT